MVDSQGGTVKQKSNGGIVKEEQESEKVMLDSQGGTVKWNSNGGTLTMEQ